MAKVGIPTSIDMPEGEVSGAERPQAQEKTYGQILKSTALIGGSQVVDIAMRIIRAKAMATLLGPAGFGLFGLYSSIANLVQSIAGMGVNSSGVRQIAEAVGSHNNERIARTAAVLRRTSILLGALGAALLIIFSRQVSIFTFGVDRQAMGVALLSIAVFFNLLSAGQGALIQGVRNISDLARMGVWGAVSGTVITIPLVYILGEAGIVPSIILTAALTLLISWWYSRKVKMPFRSMTVSQGIQEAAALLKLGFAFLASGLMAMGSAYVTRIIVVHKLGLEATGLYQSAWTLGGLYVGMLLQAMGADFYPRLTASAADNGACNRLVNEQTYVSILLAGPGAIATLTFAPVVIKLFYNQQFAAAVGILRWICIGAALQTTTWPMGFIIIAKGAQALFFWCEVAWGCVSVALAWVCVRRFGVTGAGMAFLGSYIFHAVLLYPIVQSLSGFTWSSTNIRTGLASLALICFVFLTFSSLPPWIATVIGTMSMLVMIVHSIRTLFYLASPNCATTLLRGWMSRTRVFHTDLPG